MPPEPSELRAIAETALRALNAGDLDGFLEVVADDVEFTSMILEVEGQTFRGRDGVRAWWQTVATRSRACSGSCSSWPSRTVAAWRS
jgi:ketosteroid isomerase-like protein